MTDLLDCYFIVFETNPSFPAAVFMQFSTNSDENISNQLNGFTTIYSKLVTSAQDKNDRVIQSANIRNPEVGITLPGVQGAS